LGGSFNPPHEAHRAASLLALKRLRLDHVWWLVTPGNPLKDTRALPPLTARIAAARRVARHPRIHVTGIEAALGTRFTIDTLAALKRRCPRVRFVWLMGADNLPQFHRWRNWRAIAETVPIAVVDRAPAGLAAIAGIAPQALAAARIPETAAPILASRRPPAWVYLHGLKSALSSTALRQRIERHAG
jgi:nicotinate-nucleotide adenylyltransferase